MKTILLLILILLSSCVSPKSKTKTKLKEIKGYLIGNGKRGSSEIITQGKAIYIYNGDRHKLNHHNNGVFEITALLKINEGDNGIWGRVRETPKVYESPASKALREIGARIYGQRMTFEDKAVPSGFIEHCNKLPFIQEIFFNKGSVDFSALHKLKFVTKLNFDNVDFKGENLGSLFELPSLKDLDINKAKNIGGIELSKISRIERFSLDYDVIDSNIFRKMPNLKSLCLSNVRDIAKDKNNLYGLSKLESLLLFGCKEFVLQNNDFSKFNKLDHLTIRAQITSDDIRSLPINLKELWLYETQVDDRLINLLPPKLIDLDLRSAPITDKLIKHLPVSLERLDINKTKITPNCIDDLCKLTNLKYLDMDSLTVDSKKLWQLVDSILGLCSLSYNKDSEMSGTEELGLTFVLESRSE